MDLQKRFTELLSNIGFIEELANSKWLELEKLIRKKHDIIIT